MLQDMSELVPQFIHSGLSWAGCECSPSSPPTGEWWEWCQTMKYLLQEVEGLGAGELSGPREAAVTLHLLMFRGKLELGEPGQDTSPALGSAAGDRGGQTHSAAWAGCWE